MTITKRSVVVDGHKTSVSLEDEFWEGLRVIAARKNQKRSILVAKIAEGRTGKNLSSAIRLFVLDHFRTSVGQGNIQGNIHFDSSVSVDGKGAISS